MKNKQEYLKDWRKKVKAKGFKQVYFCVPKEFEKELRQFVRLWKAQNHHYYEGLNDIE